MPSPRAPYLRASGLTKRFPGAARASAEQVSFTLEKGEMLALLGPSGCGKTTLLRMIAGLDRADAGDLTVDGRDMRDVPLHLRNMGMVFQSYALFPHLTVARNIAFGLEVRGTERAARERKVAEMAALTRLEGLETRRVAALSGGQRQRVALARALAFEPGLLLLDEPLANLDVKLREAMRAEIRALQRRLGVTAIFVTHDQEEALSIADRVAVMAEGRLQQIGAPADIYERPVNRFVASFVGRGNFLAARRDGGFAVIEGVGRLAFPGAAWTGTRTLLLRPHHIRLGGTGKPGSFTCPGVVADVTYMGDRRIVRVAVGPHRVEVEQLAGREIAPAAGETVSLSWEPDDMIVLDDPA